ncbi:FBX4 protein, partial [Polyodon spathula]|nr:FBX4 protein [Polyodon spathula]
LQVDMKFYVMSFLSPQDLCKLGSTCQYWHTVVRDPVLWRYFLLRDLPTFIDHNSMPDMEKISQPLGGLDDSTMHDYMTEYLKSCPGCRRRLRPYRRGYAAVTSFLHSLVINTEPRLAMFEPGLEQLELSLVRKMRHSLDVIPVAGFPQRQINGMHDI